MRRKNEIAYLLVLVVSILLIYTTFQTAFTNVTLNEVEEKTRVFFLSFDQCVNLAAGLLLFGFTAYLYLHLSSYKAGRLFAWYLTFITGSICLAAVTNNQYTVGNLLISILAFLSNIFLFYSIGFLTVLTHRKFFRFSLLILGAFTLIFMILSLVCMNTDWIVFLFFKDKIIFADYFLTMLVTIINMGQGYQGATIYQKRQIKFLSYGLLFGIIAFLVMRWMPMLAMVKVPEHQEEMVVYYQMDSSGGNQDLYPIMVFTGMAIVMIYILMKREYLVIDENHDLLRYLMSVIYLLVGNSYFLLFSRSGLNGFFLFQAILVAPLIAMNHRIWKKRKNIYDHNLIEVLEEERQRISVLLHDEVLQDLIALSHSIKEGESKVRLSGVISEIRNISQDLYPTIVEDLGLEQALNVLMEEIGADYNIELSYNYDYPKGVLPKGISLVVYRTVKELVNNAIKHSGCDSISVLIQAVQGGMECVINDNGRGFLVPENMELLKSPHMGLYTVRKQISDLNGNMRIISDKTGSKFQIFIPLKI